MKVQLIALDRCLGAIPVVIGELCRHLISKLVLRSGGSQAKEACKSVNLCARLKEGIEVPIHTFKEREDMGRGEMWEDRRERLKTEYQARNRIEILHMREMRESGRTMGTISEEREGGEDAKESDSKKKEDLDKNLKS